MERVIQLALFLENRPGTLAAVCDALAAEQINIYALTISDTVDHSVVRMVVSDAQRALSIFEAHGTLVVESDVILIEHDNKPGSLSTVAKKLAAHDVNIEYAYTASGPHARIGTVILRVNDIDRALEVLGAESSTVDA